MKLFVLSSTSITLLAFPLALGAPSSTSLNPLPPYTSSSVRIYGTPSPLPTPLGSQDDISAYLHAHNVIRAKKGAHPLTWNTKLASAAQKVVATCQFQHSHGRFGDYGENLAAGNGSYPIATAVEDWIDEERDYDPRHPVPSHYTQVVWKGSRQVGCAVHYCPMLTVANIEVSVSTCAFFYMMLTSASAQGAHFYACEYYPPGNYIGRFP